jgi:hypothetical protein
MRSHLAPRLDKSTLSVMETSERRSFRESECCALHRRSWWFFHEN